MDIKNIDVLDEDSGLILCNGLVVISLFEGYKWYFDEIQSDHGYGSIITAIDPEGVNEVCHILIVDATNDRDEPDISELSLKDVETLSKELMEGVSATFNSPDQEVLSFSESKLVLSNMRRFFISDYLVREGGVIYKYASYRTTVNNRKVVIQSTHPLLDDKTIENKLYVIIDGIKFIDNASDREFIDQFPYIPQVVNIEDFCFPLQVRGFTREGDIVDYESQTPGMGYSVHYSSVIGEATVYVYNDRQTDIPEDIMDPSIAEYFNAQFKSIEASLHNNDCSIADVDEPYVLNCVVASVISAAFVVDAGDDRRQQSYFYLSTLNNYYVKVRITSQYVTESSEDFDNFVCELFHYLTGTNKSVLKSLNYLDRSYKCVAYK